MNHEKYAQIFKKTFQLNEGDSVEGLSYQSIPAWDSVGHMELVAALETEFDISLDMDDVIDFSSFEVGKKILEKYKIQFNKQ